MAADRREDEDLIIRPLPVDGAQLTGYARTVRALHVDMVNRTGDTEVWQQALDVTKIAPAEPVLAVDEHFRFERCTADDRKCGYAVQKAPLQDGAHEA